MRTIIILITVASLSGGMAIAQRGDIIIQNSAAVITIPAGAQLCADRYFANNAPYGTLNYGNNPSRICGPVIPVELLTFSASLESGVVLLRWTTVSETNCHGFEVQRLLPASGQSWNLLSFVPGSGTSTSAREYSSLDRLENVGSIRGSILYRLRMIDLDGSYQYSDIEEVRLEASATDFTFDPVHPNPASDRMTISFSLPEASDVRVTAYSTTGAEAVQLISVRSFDRGRHSISISTSGLSRGAYLIELQAGGQRKTRTIMVR